MTALGTQIAVGAAKGNDTRLGRGVRRHGQAVGAKAGAEDREAGTRLAARVTEADHASAFVTSLLRRNS